MATGLAMQAAAKLAPYLGDSKWKRPKTGRAKFHTLRPRKQQHGKDSGMAEKEGKKEREKGEKQD